MADDPLRGHLVPGWNYEGRARFRPLCGVVLLVLFCCHGCVSARKRIEPEAPTSTADLPIDPVRVYTVACPDAVEIVWLDHPDSEWIGRIGADGCLNLPAIGSIRVEGLTTAEIARQIAARSAVFPERVQVRVAEFASRQVFLFGQVEGGPRAVDYRGPERIIDLLRRAGGLSPDAALNEIYVLRAQVGEGIPAEILTVDLPAILQRGDQSTNVRVQPLDEIYIGEKPRSRIRRALPTFLKPLYEGVVGFIPHPDWRTARRATHPVK